MINVGNVTMVRTIGNEAGSSFPSLRNVHRFCGSDIRLATQVGMRTGRDMVSTGLSGCLLYGPYIALAGGDYRVVIRGALGENGAAAARVDVVVDRGNRILMESSINQPHQDGCLVSLPISLDAPCTDLEVRVWVEAHSQVTISMLEIQPIPASEMESAENQLTAACADISPQDELPCPSTLHLAVVAQILTPTPPLVHRSDIGSGDRPGGAGIISLENIIKVYDTRQGLRTVLNGVNLRIAKGEKVGIVGRNGAGKSTLMRLISGAELPTHGQINRGMSVSWPLAFGGGFQGSLSGLDNLRFICRVYGVSYEGAIPFVEEFCELGSYLREPVKKYSSGMRARLAFALSMAVEFDCFLIDEIIAVGDSRFHARCHEELFEKRKDRAMILVSHQPHFIRDYCDRAGVLIDAKLHMFDQVDEAFAFYQEYSG